ncbi:MAG TPA: hypothetical protein VF549_05470 [Solirubrobacteraceae bacterium]|jgi:hypothetical protein
MDDPKHNPGEPEFGDHAEDAAHNPGEPQFGEQEESTEPDESPEEQPGG